MAQATVTHRIGHVSDSHFTVSGTMHETIRPAETFAVALEALEASGVPIDLLVHTGDIADEGEPAAYAEALRTARPLLDRTGWPMLWVPGNHDDRPAMRRHLLGIAPGSEPMDVVHETGGLRVVALDTSIPGHVEGRIDADRLEWLHELLRRAAEHGTVLAMHHPPLPADSTVFERFRLTGQHELARAIEGLGVRAVLAGHLHWATAGVLGAVPVFVAPSSAYTIRLTAPGGGVVGADGGRAVGVLSLWDDGRVAWSLLPTDPAPIVARADEQVFAEMGIDPDR